MFNLDAHAQLTLYATLLYFITNYLCNDKQLSSQFMKMFNIKTKSSMQILCLVLFGIGFYFVAEGMVKEGMVKEGFKVGGDYDVNSHLKQMNNGMDPR